MNIFKSFFIKFLSIKSVLDQFSYYFFELASAPLKKKVFLWLVVLHFFAGHLNNHKLCAYVHKKFDEYLQKWLPSKEDLR